MDFSYDVKIWKIETRTWKTKMSYRVVWFVSGERFNDTFDTIALADSHRSDLVAAARRGEAFDRTQGLPVSMLRQESDMPCIVLARKYIDMKWNRAAAKSRAGNADALATVIPALLSGTKGMPEVKTLRRAMTGWAFNTKRRDAVKPPEIERALRWLEDNTVPASRLNDVGLLRDVLELLSCKLDGTQAAAKTVNRKRAVFYNFLEYAHEVKVVTANRLPEVKWKAPKSVRAIDKRVVINPAQAKALLAAVAAQRVEREVAGESEPVLVARRSVGSTLVAFFAVMYYAGLRPEEAAMLRKQDLQLPEKGWGELLLSAPAPIAGAAWTDSGERRDRRRSLKQRAEGEVRPVPSSPPLTAILQEHLSTYGAASDGRLFRSLAGGDLAESTVGRAWDKARRTALTAEEYASKLAKRPYDLRHACVSTWLAAGVPSAQVAEWAGHSVAVLHQVYAQVVAGLESAAHQRIEEALGWHDDDLDAGE